MNTQKPLILAIAFLLTLSCTVRDNNQPKIDADPQSQHEAKAIDDLDFFREVFESSKDDTDLRSLILKLSPVDFYADTAWIYYALILMNGIGKDDELNMEIAKK
jgi:hypothetical protein